MKKIIFLLFCCAILFSGCKNRNGNQIDSKSSENTKHSFALHPKIMDVIKEFRSQDQTDRIYAVYFTDTNDGFSMLKQDTIVYVSFLHPHPFVKNVTYKGILIIDSLTVAIFDRNNSGVNFYDSTKLSHISLTQLKSLPEDEINSAAALGVDRDSLIRWIAP